MFFMKLYWIWGTRPEPARIENVRFIVVSLGVFMRSSACLTLHWLLPCLIRANYCWSMMLACLTMFCSAACENL